MIKIEINDKEYEVKEGSTIIENADNIGISIPRFCYHNKLSIAANCRMCLVQIDATPKPTPACSTTVTPGMKIWTQSKTATDAQKSVMEFLLINHPLDCPICDQGGECELQDTSLQFGSDVSKYAEGKRAVKSDDLGPLIATEMTRCIHCTRCVRFGTEIAGMRELGATSRGEFMQIGTFIEKNVTSELSGNVIDLCPVGALTSKPFSYKARAFEMRAIPYFSTHDSLGSNIYMHVRRNEVLRVVPKENEDLNEIWISDRDRFSYEALLHEDRVRFPKIKHNGRFEETSWLKSLEYTMFELKQAIVNNGTDAVAVLAGNNISLEEGFLLQKVMRKLGIKNIDHRLQQQDFKYDEIAFDPIEFKLDVANLDKQKVIMLFGSILPKEIPVLSTKLLKAKRRGAYIAAINPLKYDFSFDVDKTIDTNDYLSELVSIAKALGISDPYLESYSTKYTSAQKELAKLIKSTEQGVILLGALVQKSKAFTEILYVSNLIASNSNIKVSLLNINANVGLTAVGLVPYELKENKIVNQGDNAFDMLTKPYKVYILYGIEPEFDSLAGKTIKEQLDKADLVVVINPYINEQMAKYADVILPSVPYSEQDGTFINLAKQQQSYKAAVTPYGEARPGWKILRVLGNMVSVDNCNYETSQEILLDLTDWMRTKANVAASKLSTVLTNKAVVTQKIVTISSLYSTDPIVRRAKSLQMTEEAKTLPVMLVNSQTAKQYKLQNATHAKLKTKSGEALLDLQIAASVAADTIVIRSAEKITSKIGYVLQDQLEISPCN